MHKTFATAGLLPIIYVPQPDGTAEVWLRENIEREEDEGGLRLYVADEVRFKTRHPYEYVEEHFDEMWVTAVKAEKSLEERIDELEDQLGAAIDVLLMMSEGE